LFALKPERAHDAGVFLLKTTQKILPKAKKNISFLAQKIFNKEILHPVCMAAGFDKTGEVFTGLIKLGFSFVEIGTFTPKFQAGNDKPRIFRLPKEKAVINRMGFNNPGILTGLQNAQKLIKNSNNKLNIAISIGKQKETPLHKAFDDYRTQLIEIKNNKDIVQNCLYAAVNISSPNTPGLRDLQNSKYLSELIYLCKEVTDLPIVIKFAPDFENMKDFQNLVKSVLKSKASGIIVTNTSTKLINEPYVPEYIKKKGGGLSGLPLTEISEKYLQETINIVQQQIPVISSGGIMKPVDIWFRLCMGASLTQLYTGFIYNGPYLIKDSLKYLEKKFNEYNIKSFEDFQKERNYICKIEKINSKT